MSVSDAGGKPSTQPAFSGRPPRPPKVTARGVEDQPDEPNKVIFLPDPVVVRELAVKLGKKPFEIVADLLDRRIFKNADETIDFGIASEIASSYGFKAIPLTDQNAL